MTDAIGEFLKPRIVKVEQVNGSSNHATGLAGAT
jgi:hypothetical protein